MLPNVVGRFVSLYENGVATELLHEIQVLTEFVTSQSVTTPKRYGPVQRSESPMRLKIVNTIAFQSDPAP